MNYYSRNLVPCVCARRGVAGNFPFAKRFVAYHSTFIEIIRSVEIAIRKHRTTVSHFLCAHKNPFGICRMRMSWFLALWHLSLAAHVQKWYTIAPMPCHWQLCNSINFGLKQKRAVQKYRVQLAFDSRRWKILWTTPRHGLSIHRVSECNLREFHT